jgi:hypothetical protein
LIAPAISKPILSVVDKQPCHVDYVTSFAISPSTDLAKLAVHGQGTHMKFRLKAFGLHLAASASALSLILGLLYLGWYHWPGWRLTDVTPVVTVLIGVDLVLGPLMTLIIANGKKSRRELTRDVGIIVAVQLCALIYGSTALWNGRPLYYAFSESELQLVQAYDINSDEAALGRQKNPSLAPHWYSLPRWIWAPLPQNPEESNKIVLDATLGKGDDVTSMPRYFKPWDQGLPALRDQLKKVDDVAYFSKGEKKKLKELLQASGLPSDQPNAMPLTGRGHPLLAVFDPASFKIAALLSPK